VSGVPYIPCDGGAFPRTLSSLIRSVAAGSRSAGRTVVQPTPGGSSAGALAHGLLVALGDPTTAAIKAGGAAADGRPNDAGEA
jgi:hypothetical protein